MTSETQFHFFGIVDSSPTEIETTELPIQLVQFNKLSAVLYPASFTEADMLDKSKLVCLLKTYQNTLESLRTTRTIVPVQLSTRHFTQFTILQILNDYHAPLSSLISKLQGKAEFEVQVLWTNIQQVLKQIASTQEFLSLMQNRLGTQNGNMVKVEDQIYIGNLLAEILEKKRKTISQEIIAILGPYASNFKALPITDETLAAHVSFLIDSSKEEIFYAELEKFSKICEFSELLKFKVIGPLVPYNFATILVNYLNGREVENFRSLLNLSNDIVSEKDLKKQMRELALTHHPDKDKTQEEIFKKIIDAYKLISSLIETEPTKTIELSKYKEHYVLTVPSINQELVLI